MSGWVSGRERFETLSYFGNDTDAAGNNALSDARDDSARHKYVLHYAKIK